LLSFISFSTDYLSLPWIGRCRVGDVLPAYFSEDTSFVFGMTPFMFFLQLFDPGFRHFVFVAFLVVRPVYNVPPSVTRPCHCPISLARRALPPFLPLFHSLNSCPFLLQAVSCMLLSFLLAVWGGGSIVFGLGRWVSPFFAPPVRA